MDEVIESARNERSPAARTKIYDQFERLLVRDALFTPLFHEIDYRVAASPIRGMRLRAARPYVNYGDLTKEAATRTQVAGQREGILTVPLTASGR